MVRPSISTAFMSSSKRIYIAITQYREDIKKLKQEIERADGRFRTTQRKLAEGTDKYELCLKKEKKIIMRKS